MLRILLLMAAVFALPGGACASTVNDIARIKGQGRSVLQGIGLVVGLSGTGDSGKELALARPLAEVLRHNGNPIPDLRELEKTKSVAMVMVMCTVPENGARVDSRFDATVAVIGSATSLRGGVLYLAPLTGPYREDKTVYAIASGEVHVEDEKTPTTGRVRDGAQMTRDVVTGQVGDSFMLLLNPYVAGWSAAAEIAGTITQTMYGRTARDIAREALPPIATAIDDHTVRIDIPPAERTNPGAFVADILATDIVTTQLKLPARVICNAKSGAILVTGDVEISPVAFTLKDLAITTTMPAPVATQQDPLVNTARWAAMDTGARPTDKAKLQDLLDAFKQLEVPVAQQIEVLAMMDKAGQLHAKLIIE